MFPIMSFGNYLSLTRIYRLYISLFNISMGTLTNLFIRIIISRSFRLSLWYRHLKVVASRITANFIVCPTTHLDWQQLKHQSLSQSALCDGNPLVTGGVPFPEGPVMRKAFPFHNVYTTYTLAKIMISIYRTTKDTAANMHLSYTNQAWHCLRVTLQRVVPILLAWLIFFNLEWMSNYIHIKMGKIHYLFA